MEDSSFNKYQFSVFTKDNGQFVVRSNDFGEFTEQLKQVLALKKASDATVTPQNDVVAAHNQLKTAYPPCKSCGGESVYNPRTGKIFCKNKCWLNAGQLSANQ